MSHDELTLERLDRMESTARRELLNAYLDGELSAERALVVSQWLDDNPGALREVEHLRHIWDLLESYEDEPVPESFASSVLDTVGVKRPGATEAAEGGRVIPMAWYRRPLATAAAVLIAIGATAFVMSDRGDVPAGGGEYGASSGNESLSARSGVDSLEALGLEDLETLEYLHVIADADDEAFDDLVAGAGLGG